MTLDDNSVQVCKYRQSARNALPVELKIGALRSRVGPIVQGHLRMGKI